MHSLILAAALLGQVAALLTPQKAWYRSSINMENKHVHDARESTMVRQTAVVHANQRNPGKRIYGWLVGETIRYTEAENQHIFAGPVTAADWDRWRRQKAEGNLAIPVDGPDPGYDSAYFGGAARNAGKTLINETRRRLGVSPLKFETMLMAAAHSSAEDYYKTGQTGRVLKENLDDMDWPMTRVTGPLGRSIAGPHTYSALYYRGTLRETMDRLVGYAKTRPDDPDLKNFLLPWTHFSYFELTPEGLDRFDSDPRNPPALGGENVQPGAPAVIVLGWLP